MDQLGELLGQNKLAEGISHVLGKSGSRLWLTGPSGSGKSEIANLVAAEWKGDLFRVTGVEDFANIPFLPLHRALEGKREHRAIRKLDKDETVDIIKDLPFGNTLRMLARRFLARYEDRGPEFLNSNEEELLASLQKAALYENVLFIIDNAHWLDPSSLDLLLKLSLPEVEAAYSFVGRSSFLFVETDGQPRKSDGKALRRLKDSASERRSVHYPTADQFPDVLKYLGVEPGLDPAMVTHLYSITRGHLKLAQEVIRLVNEATVITGVFTSAHEEEIDQLAARLLTLRLTDLPEGANSLTKLLSIASCMGGEFSSKELECAFKDTQNFLAALELARKEKFIAGDGDSLQFSHDVILAALKVLTKAESPDFHDRLAECVRAIRPGDYRARLHHSLKSSNMDRSSQLACAVRLQIDRGEDFEGPDDVLLLATYGKFTDQIEAIRQARAMMDEGRVREAIGMLSAHYTGADSIIQAEMAYIISLCYYKGRSTRDYEKAVKLLDPWKDRKAEVEIWYRLMLTLAVVYVGLGNDNQATQILSNAKKRMERYVSFDPTARTKLQIANRKADIFYPVEIATTMLREAASYFSPPPGSSFPRNAFQYTAAVTNLSGNLYCLGRFKEASEASLTAVNTIALIDGRARTVEAYKPFNNYVISALRGGLITAADGASALGELKVDKDLDRVLVTTHQASLAALAGDIEAGAQQLQENIQRVEHEDAESYYFVYVAANYCVAMYLAGKLDIAHQYLDKVDTRLDDLSKDLKRCLHQRQSALRRAFASDRRLSPEEIDEFPRLEDPSGPDVIWATVGRGFIFSDIQVWSES